MEIIYDFFKGTFFGMYGIVGVLFTVFILYLLGRTGAIIRSGLEAKRILRNIKSDASAKGLLLSEKWFAFNKSATIWILVPPLSWLSFYAFAYFLFPTKLFLLSLVILILPILGSMGYFFRLNDNVEDYF